MKFISKGNTKIGRIAIGAEYRMDEKFQNLLIFGISLIFQITKKITFQIYLMYGIPKIYNLDK